MVTSHLSHKTLVVRDISGEVRRTDLCLSTLEIGSFPVEHLEVTVEVFLTLGIFQAASHEVSALHPVIKYV